MSKITDAEIAVFVLEGRHDGYTLGQCRNHVSPLIADWRKRGEALENVRRRISSDAGNKTFDHASELIDWIDDECRAALTPPPRPAEATPTPLSQAK